MTASRPGALAALLLALASGCAAANPASLPRIDGHIVYDRPIAEADEPARLLWKIYEVQREWQVPEPPFRYRPDLSDAERERWLSWMDVTFFPWLVQRSADANQLAGALGMVGPDSGDPFWSRPEGRLFEAFVTMTVSARLADILRDIGIGPPVHGSCDHSLEEVLDSALRDSVGAAERCQEEAAVVPLPLSSLASACGRRASAMRKVLATAVEGVCEVQPEP